MSAFWITFYSYKGGVGRSLAVANIAALLVRTGRRVVLIDFDLEAPGLDSFPEFKHVSGKPGVVEYVTEYKRTNSVPNIQRFVHACDPPEQLRGQLWIMPAGRKGPQYNADRASLNWSELYEKHRGEDFVENWKGAIAHYYQPDYVLVDSRTGLTEVGGICTLHLPDLVVMVFALNEQNVKGVAAVAKAIHDSNPAIPLHYVVSPLPNLPRDKGGALDNRWEEASATLGCKIESSIRYEAAAALGEGLFVLEPPLANSTLPSDYESLLDRLVAYNRNGLDFLLTAVKASILNGDKVAMRRLAEALVEYGDSPDGLMALASLSEALGEHDKAVNQAERAVELEVTFEPAFEWLVRQYRREDNLGAILSLCDIVLSASERLDRQTLMRVHRLRGETAMASRRFEDAGYSFAQLLSELEEDGDAAEVAICEFNRVEAVRRSVREPRREVWLKVMARFKGIKLAPSLPFLASRLQAMHIAYAMSGDPARARDALRMARTTAELLSSADEVFTIKNYTVVPVQEFIKINDEMLAALDQGQLWDGMPLPAGKPPTDVQQ